MSIMCCFKKSALHAILPFSSLRRTARIRNLVLVFCFLFVINVSATTHSITLKFISNLPLPGRTRYISLKDHYAYVALNHDGLAIVDVSNPEQPKFIKQLKQDFTPLHLVIEGNLCYEGDRERGLQIFDVSEPLTPRLVERIQLPAPVIYIYPTEKYFFLACGGAGLQIVQRFTQPHHNQLGLLSAYTETDFSKMIVARDNTLYLADNYDAGLKIFDITEATSPTLMAKYSVDGFCDVLALRDNYLFVSKRRAGVIIADISIPDSPRVIGRIVRLNNSIKDFKLHNHLLFTANDENGIEVFDVSQPTNPLPVAKILTKDRAVNITIKDTLLFVADWEAGLTILQVQQ